MNPRSARVVALTKPTETERGQWYFQRYVAHLPAAGEIVLFDRSWYNRAGVERVMGFTSPRDYLEFMRQAPQLEQPVHRAFDRDALPSPPVEEPRIVGETGGKDFVIAHKSANAEVVATALLRGAFEYQGQKC